MTIPVSAASSPVGSPAAALPAPATAPPGGALGKDAFMKLLVAQLRYQNPMSPLEGADFMAQTAQFTMLERLEDIARQGAELLAAEGTRTAATLLGRRVSYPGADGGEASGVVTGTRLGPTGPVLLVGDDEVPLSSVREVTLAP